MIANVFFILCNFVSANQEYLSFVSPIQKTLSFKISPNECLCFIRQKVRNSNKLYIFANVFFVLRYLRFNTNVTIEFFFRNPQRLLIRSIIYNVGSPNQFFCIMIFFLINTVCFHIFFTSDVSSLEKYYNLPFSCRSYKLANTFRIFLFCY